MTSNLSFIIIKLLFYFNIINLEKVRLKVYLNNLLLI